MSVIVMPPPEVEAALARLTAEQREIAAALAAKYVKEHGAAFGETPRAIVHLWEVAISDAKNPRGAPVIDNTSGSPSETEHTMADSSDLRIYDFDQLLALELPPERFLIAPYIPLGGLTVVSAKRSSWKTWCTDYIGLTVAAKVEGSEHNLFNQFETMPGRVLILQLEGSLGEHQRRIKGLVQSNVFGTVKGLPLFTYWGPLRSESAATVEALRRTIRELKPDLVIADNVRLLFPGSENDSEEFGRNILLFTQEMQAVHPSTWFAIAHPDKRGNPGIRGSSAQEGNLDSLLLIERKGDVAHVVHEKARTGKEGESFAFRFIGPEEIGGAGFVYCGAPDSPEAIDLEQRILTVLNEEGGRLSRSALIERLGKEQERRIDRAIAKLERDGMVKKDPAGREVFIVATKKAKPRRDAS